MYWVGDCEYFAAKNESFLDIIIINTNGSLLHVKRLMNKTNNLKTTNGDDS